MLVNLNHTLSSSFSASSLLSAVVTWCFQLRTDWPWIRWALLVLVLSLYQQLSCRASRLCHPTVVPPSNMRRCRQTGEDREASFGPRAQCLEENELRNWDTLFGIFFIYYGIHTSQQANSNGGRGPGATCNLRVARPARKTHFLVLQKFLQSFVLYALWFVPGWPKNIFFISTVELNIATASVSVQVKVYFLFLLCTFWLSACVKCETMNRNDLFFNTFIYYLLLLPTGCWKCLAWIHFSVWKSGLIEFLWFE